MSGCHLPYRLTAVLIVELNEICEVNGVTVPTTCVWGVESVCLCACLFCNGVCVFCVCMCMFQVSAHVCVLCKCMCCAGVCVL